MKSDNLIPKILIACPTSDRHEHLIEEWLSHLDSLTYPNFDVCLVDTSQNNSYYQKLKKMKLKGHQIIVLRHKWDNKKLHPVQMLAHAREKIRQYFLEHKEYSNIFWLDDDIFVPKFALQRLISYQKDCVGFYVHVFYKPHRVPCLLKSGEIISGKGLDFFTFSEINAYKNFVKNFRKDKLSKEEKKLISFIIKDKFRPQLIKTYGVNLGCLMCSRKVMETVQFRTHETFINGEDLWFFAEANDKHFEFWCDTDHRCRHENTEWHSLISQSPRRMNFSIVKGPVDAKEGVILKHK